MIKVENLSYTYRGANMPTLKQLNFEIGSGEIFGFLGPSGAGKSTTQKVLYKILKDYGGEIHINGVNLKSLGKHYLENIGVGFEMPNHYVKLSGKENLDLFAAFYPEESMLDIAALFELVGLEDSIHLINAPAVLKQEYGKQLVEVKLANGEEQQFPIMGLGQNSHFSAFINQSEVASIRTMEATLEEVFLTATGKHLKS